MNLHFCFLMAAVGQLGIRPEGIQLAPVDSALFAMIWIEIVCVLLWEYRGSRSAKTSQTDRRGLSVLLELARTWPRTRSNQVEAVFVAAGGQRLDYAGSREVVRLLKSEWSSKPTFLVLFFAPGAGGEILAVEGPQPQFGSKKLIDDAAKSLWIPIRRTDSWAIAPFWPIASAWIGGSIAIIGSDLNASADVRSRSASPAQSHPTVVRDRTAMGQEPTKANRFLDATVASGVVQRNHRNVTNPRQAGSFRRRWRDIRETSGQVVVVLVFGRHRDGGWAGAPVCRRRLRRRWVSMAND